MARHSFEDIKTYLISQTRFGKTFDEVVDFYIQESKDKDLNQSDVRSIFKKAASKEHFRNFEYCQTILSSDFIKDVADDDFYLLDPVSKSLEKISEIAIKDVFDSKGIIKLKSEKQENCRIGYNPENSEMYFKTEDSRINFINTHRPANWNFDYFYGNKPIPKVDKIPEVYEKYLRNLVSTEQSYQLCISFWATAVQKSKRMASFLTMCGGQGMGKGVFGSIAEQLCGPINFVSINCKDLTSVFKFNSRMQNKRILQLDELTVKTTEEQSLLKDLVNNSIEIEKKYKDVINSRNYMSIFVATNSLGALKCEQDDRRYTFIDMGKKKLKTFCKEEYNLDVDAYVNKYLLDSEAIKSLGEFLLNYKIPIDHLTDNIKTEYSKVTQSNSLQNWQICFLDTLCPRHQGKVVNLNEVKDHLDAELNDSFVKKLSHRAFKQLEDEYPMNFKLIRRGTDSKTRYFAIQYAPIEQQVRLNLGEQYEEDL